MPSIVDRMPEKKIDQVIQESALCRKFIEDFSKADADEVLKCGLHHLDRIRGDDYFLDCLVMGVGYRCFIDFHDTHGFEALSHEIIEWLQRNVSNDDLEYYKAQNEIMKTHRKHFEEIFGK